jgi:uncharacterized membrane protein
MSRRTLRIVMVVLAAAGLALATYLAYVHYAGIKIACVQGHDECAAVQSSVYSKLGGVPVALMGAIGYLAILASLLLPENESTRLATLVLTLGGFGFSVYLTYREVFSLEKICEWCVGSAILLTILMCLSVWRFLRGGEPAAADVSASAGGRGEPSSQTQLSGAP